MKPIGVNSVREAMNRFKPAKRPVRTGRFGRTRAEAEPRGAREEQARRHLNLVAPD